MTERENFLRVINFDNPEWVPTGVPSYQLYYQGCNHEGYAGGGHDCPVGTKWVDIWGTEWHKEHADVMGFPRGNPLAEVDKLADYQWPDPDDPRIIGKLQQQFTAYTPGDYLLSGSHRDTLWEKAYMLVGMENMMIYFYEEPEFARTVLHKIMDFHIGIARHYLACGIELACCGDDLGTQSAPLLNPTLVHEFLEPEYERLFSLYRQHDVIIHFHSCGHIEEFLDMFLRLGVRILNPIQVKANNLELIRRVTNGRITLNGGISTVTLMEGPVEAIQQEVRQRMWQLGRDGGYICAPDQGMPWSPENYQAYRDAVAQYGRYPLLEV